MDKELNATCAICGKPYHMCNTCRHTISYMPWRTIADTSDCYKIYMIIYQYNYKVIDKEKAKEMLEKCKLPETFQPHIKKVIDEIMGISEVKEDTKNKSKKGVSSK